MSRRLAAMAALGVFLLLSTVEPSLTPLAFRQTILGLAIIGEFAAGIFAGQTRRVFSSLLVAACLGALPLYAFLEFRLIPLGLGGSFLLGWLCGRWTRR